MDHVMLWRSEVSRLNSGLGMPDQYCFSLPGLLNDVFYSDVAGGAIR
jgi:hypothetical protein